jgi:hypothetical protein
MPQSTMEDNNYRTDFELFLRESIEDFKMIPARKIWHSIYNNMHPDRKWPSITVCALILFCVLYVGISNNNSINKAALAAKNQIAYSNDNDIVVNEKTNSQNKDFSFGKNIDNTQIKTEQENPTIPLLNNIDKTSKTISVENNLSSESSFISNNKYNETIVTTASNSLLTKVIVANNSSLKIKRKSITQNNLPTTTINATIVKTEIKSINTLNKSYNSAVKKDNNSNILADDDVVLTPVNEKNRINNYSENNDLAFNSVTLKNNVAQSNSRNKAQQETLEKNEIDILTNKKKAISAEIASTTDLLKKEIASLKADSKENIVNNTQKEKTITEQKNESVSASIQVSKAQARKNAVAKFKKKSIISYYVTPSYGFRTLSSVVNNANTQRHKDVASLNFEAGFAVTHKISKDISLKAGVQANYTNYVSKVTDIGHSTQTSLRSANPQLDDLRSSQYSTNEGDANLNRSNIQIAIPIGVDFKLLGNDKIKWYVGATVQPTYVVSDNSYVFSGDEKYYILEKSLQRKFNINTAFETYLSIKTRKGVTFNVGPQFRYQLLNSYKKDYKYNEKLYNVGLKIGVSTSF